MNLYCIKCSKLTKNNNIKTNYKIDEKIIFILVVLTVVLEGLKLLIKNN